MKLIKLFSFIIVTLILTNVTLTNRAVDQAITVSALSTEIESLSHANTLLNAEIAQLGSLTALSEQIASAGFVEHPVVVALPAISAVASR